GGLSRIKDGGVATLDSRAGLPCDATLWSLPDDVGSVWILMPCGLLQVPMAEMQAWVSRVEATEPPIPVQFTVFGSADGVRLLGHRAALYKPQVSKAPDGRIWFSVSDGVSVIDPRDLRINTLAPPVHIEQVTADRKTYDASAGLRLPPLVRD